MNKEQHRKMLKDVDERVLHRREWETDEQYGKRMHDFLNRHDIYADKCNHWPTEQANEHPLRNPPSRSPAPRNKRLEAD